MSSPYEITVAADGLNADLAPELVEAARALPVYLSSLRFPVQGPAPDGSKLPFAVRHREVSCVRCVVDDVVISPDNLAERVGHLCRDHGYRMDGRRYTDRNEAVA